MLREIILETQKIFETRDVMNLARQTVWSFRDLFGIQNGIVGICSEGDSYYTFDCGGRFSMTMENEDGGFFLLYRMEEDEAYLPGAPVYPDSTPMKYWGNAKDKICFFIKSKKGRKLGFLYYVVPEVDFINQKILDCSMEEAFSYMVQTISIAFENVISNCDYMQGQEDTILSFATVCEGQGKNTKNHVKRVSEYVKVMAINMGYSLEDANDLALSAMMHDIGKSSVPDAILDKPSSLTDEEYDKMKEHATQADQYIVDSSSSIIHNARRIAMEHHERWDGSGYLGKKEEEIDEFAAITAVADVFDVLVSKRSYKDEWTVEDAYKEIIKQAGSQFSPKVIEAFEKSFEDIVEILSIYRG